MRRTGLLLLGALGVAAAAPVHSDARDLRRSNDSTLLSIPQYAEDLAIRNHRLAYKGAYWDFVPYSAIVGPGAANLAMAAADGALGTAQWQSEVALVGGQIQATIQEANASIITKIHDKCLEINADGDCFQQLSSYETLYDAVAPEYQPASYKFWDSDYAFARERITSSPAFLKRVNALREVPFTQAAVVGYSSITGGVSMQKLVAEKRLFIVDFMPLHTQGLLVPAPNAFVEVPTAVFFLTGKPTGGSSSLRGSEGSSRLMPLAIKFNVFNQNVYSPKDTHADWFLAKAAFNALDRDVNAIHHFALHTAIANIAISANKFLASEHPLLRPILAAATNNFGIILTGFGALLAPDGLFDDFLSLSGPAIAWLLFPYYTRTFDWAQTFLSTDVEARGVTDIPGFLYRDDGSDLYDALHTYVKDYLKSFYTSDADVQGDPELAAFLAPLSNSTGAFTPENVAYLKGFPSSAQMRTREDVARMLTQILWIGGVAHHALNSYRVFDYDLVYPNHPGKILSQPPLLKGQLTDAQVVANHISGTGLITSMPCPPLNPEAQAWLSHDVMEENIGELRPLPFFLGTQELAFDFYPLLQTPQRLTNAFLSDTHDEQSAGAGTKLRNTLLTLSKRIQDREAATTDAPKYLLLDPNQLPFYLYI